MCYTGGSETNTTQHSCLFSNDLGNSLVTYIKKIHSTPTTCLISAPLSLGKHCNRNKPSSSSFLRSKDPTIQTDQGPRERPREGLIDEIYNDFSIASFSTNTNDQLSCWHKLYVVSRNRSRGLTPFFFSYYKVPIFSSSVHSYPSHIHTHTCTRTHPHKNVHPRTLFLISCSSRIRLNPVSRIEFVVNGIYPTEGREKQHLECFVVLYWIVYRCPRTKPRNVYHLNILYT